MFSFSISEQIEEDRRMPGHKPLLDGGWDRSVRVRVRVVVVTNSDFLVLFLCSKHHPNYL